MAVTVENVEKAIQEFYFGAAAHAEAHQWLTSAQISSDAWSFCWDLMNPTKPPEIQFFGANTLQVKISKHWNELPADQYATLRKKLLDYIVAYATGPKIVLTRLCIALSSYVIHTVSEHWVKAIPDIIETFQPQNATQMRVEQAMTVLIEILTVLPEEFQSMVLAHSYRGIVRHELRSSIIQVIPVLEQVLSSHCSPELHLQAIRCLSSWIQFGIPLPDLHLLLQYVMDAAKDDYLCEGALDCLTNVACHPDVHKYAAALQKLLGDLLGLETLLIKCLAEKELDKCYSIYYLFTSIAETHTAVLLSAVKKEGLPQENTLRLVNLILQCTATAGQFPVEETCSSLVFNFWYMLQDEIICKDPKKYAVYMSCFVPVYMSLVDVLMTKCIYPALEEYQTWNSDDKEQFRCYRQDIGDTLMYCYNILRESLLSRLNSHLDAVLEKIRAGDSTATKFLEACLFAFESVSESVDLEENVYLPRLFESLPTIPFTDFRVVNAALSTIGAYSEWICCHPDLLSCIIPLLLLGLSSKEMAPASTRALKEISRDCQQHMRPFAGQILTESQQALRNNSVHSNEGIRLMCTVGRVLSILDLQDILSYLTSLLTPLIQELEHLAETKPIPASQLLLVVRLNMLAMLFANLDIKQRHEEDDENRSKCSDAPSAVEKGPSEMSATDAKLQPVLVVLQQIMPIIRKVAIVWSGDPGVTETICDVLKKAISTLLDDCLPLMSDILTLMVMLYQAHPRVAILDLTKQFLLLFGKDEQHLSMLRSVFANIVNVTLALCEKGIADQTDILQGFLQILAQVLKKVPTFLLHQDFNLASLFHCGIITLSLPEAPTVKAASSFLVTFINESQEIPAMLNVVNEHGEALAMQTMRCIGGEAPRGVIDHMVDILLILNKKNFDQLCRWMNGFMLHDNFPSARISKEQKEHYIRLILKERVNKRRLQEVVKEFTLVCRGLLGTEYGMQITPYL